MRTAYNIQTMAVESVHVPSCLQVRVAPVCECIHVLHNMPPDGVSEAAMALTRQWLPILRTQLFQPTASLDCKHDPSQSIPTSMCMLPSRFLRSISSSIGHHIHSSSIRIGDHLGGYF